MSITSMPIKTLLVDDDPLSYVLTNALLARAPSNFDVHWRDTYDAALEAIDDGEYDLCLMDYTLGDRTGIDLLRYIRSTGSRMPIVMLTGSKDHETDLATMNAGADDYLVKGEFDMRL